MEQQERARSVRGGPLFKIQRKHGDPTRKPHGLCAKLTCEAWVEWGVVPVRGAQDCGLEITFCSSRMLEQLAKGGSCFRRPGGC